MNSGNIEWSSAVVSCWRERLLKDLYKYLLHLPKTKGEIISRGPGRNSGKRYAIT